MRIVSFVLTFLKYRCKIGKRPPACLPPPLLARARADDDIAEMVVEWINAAGGSKQCSHNVPVVPFYGKRYSHNVPVVPLYGQQCRILCR